LANQNFRVKNGLEVGTGVTISAGVVTASSFVGSGSQLTNITANYSNVSGVSSSVVGGGVSATSLSVVGVSTFDGAIKIRNGYNLNIGDNNDLRIYHDGTDSRIEETGSGSLYISGSDINIQQDSTNKNFARFVGGGAAELYHNDSKKFSTSGIGVTVTGTLVADQINVSGFLTATSASFSGNVSVAGTLTYEDVTNIDSVGLITARTGVRIDSGGLVVTAGVSTFAGIATVTGDTLFSKQLNISGVSTLSQIKSNSINVSGIATAEQLSGYKSLVGAASSTALTYTVTVASKTTNHRYYGSGSGNGYYLNGIESPFLTLLPGKTYRFDQSDSSNSGHPFRFYLDANRNTLYSTNVTTNGTAGSAGAYTEIFVTEATPSSLYYQCTVHSLMGHALQVSGSSLIIPNELRFITVAEKLTRSDGNTVSLVYNSNSSNIGFATNPTGNITLLVTGIPTTSDFDNHVMTFSVFVNQTGVARSCTAITLNGVSRTIKWAGGSLSEAVSGVTTTSGYDIYSFTGINTVGTASTTTNYDVLGVVNGGYR
jgi:hypothetical protein